MSRALASAVQHARRIRRKLVRHRRDTDLGGDCGLASVLLAAALDDVKSLRATLDVPFRFCTPHVWNIVAGTIIDITATQFNDLMESFKAGERPVFGVLVTREPRVYHHAPSLSGQRVLDYMEKLCWSNERWESRQLSMAFERLRARKSKISSARTQAFEAHAP